MSRVYFHSRTGETAEVYGSERLHFASVCDGIFISILKPYAKEYGAPSRLRKLVPGHYALDNWERSWEYAFLSFGSQEAIQIGDQAISPFSAALNTALMLGSDPLKLGARLHGQCEIHAYVEGQNRKWLAGIIEQGLRDKFYRSESGWESAIALLLKSSRQPIVTSYSVCEQFPNSSVAGYEYPLLDGGEKDWDAWDEIPYRKRWDMAIEGLRASGGGLELKPDNWNTLRMGAGFTAFDLIEYATKEMPVEH